MKAGNALAIALVGLLLGCKSRNEFQVVIDYSYSKNDTLFIRNLATGRPIAQIALRTGNSEHEFNIDETTLGELTIKNTEQTSLTIIRPGARKTITIDSIYVRTKNSPADSIANYLWRSTNQMFSLYPNVLFAEDNPKMVLSLFDSLVKARARKLNESKSRLTDDEFAILDYQNQARAFSFLMFYGRIMKHYPPEHDFFNFIDQIENDNIYSKSLPNNLLYKFEIQILRKGDSIQNINFFLDFIERQTKSKDLGEYLKAVYLKEVIEQPSYWRKHEHLFTTTTIKEAFQRETNNEYSYLINRAYDSFNASQEGAQGFDFVAQTLDGTELRLSDFKGKFVVIDTWATWCGPCIDQRPKAIELAQKYKDNSNVVFLLVSVDNSIERWKKYATHSNKNQYGIEVNIPDGMNKEFGQKYLIKAIPKYIFIDKNGIIINSNLPEPSIAMEQLIAKALTVGFP